MLASSHSSCFGMNAQTLASETNLDVKKQINEDIVKLKTMNSVYERLTTLMPIVLMLVCCYLAIDYLKELTTVLEACTVSMGSGAVFGVLKEPLKDKVVQEKAMKKVNKLAK